MASQGGEKKGRGPKGNPEKMRGVKRGATARAGRAATAARHRRHQGGEGAEGGQRKCVHGWGWRYQYAKGGEER